MSEAIYTLVTDKIIESLRDGVAPWRKPWCDVQGLPTNAATKHPYRGVNQWLLGSTRYTDHRWLSFKQAIDLGGHVRKGEKSSIAIFWKEWSKEEAPSPSGGDAKRVTIPVLRYYSVFNVEQCEGLEKLAPLEVVTRDNQRIERADEVARTMPDPPQVLEGGSSAYYIPSQDLVSVPPIERFESADAYYATLFHELGHSTGHAKRLNRDEVNKTVRFGSADYSREELVAELSSAFLCAAIGLDNSLMENATAYIGGWLKALRNDPKMIIQASSRAQRAADLIQGIAYVRDEAQAATA